GRLGAAVHPQSRGPHVHHRQPAGRPRLPARPHRFLRRLRRHVVLHWVRANPRARPPQQNGRHRRTVPIHPARRITASELRHRLHQPNQNRTPPPVYPRVPNRTPAHAHRGLRPGSRLRSRHHAPRHARTHRRAVRTVHALHHRPPG